MHRKWPHNNKFLLLTCPCLALFSILEGLLAHEALSEKPCYPIQYELFSANNRLFIGHILYQNAFLPHVSSFLLITCPIFYKEAF